MISDEGSSWSNLQFRFGFALKIGIDKIKYDTVFFDKNYTPPPVILASASNITGITFPGFRPPQTFTSADLKTVKEPEPVILAADTGKPLIAGAEISIPEKRKNQINTFLKKPSDILRFNFNTSTSVELSPEDKRSLDLVIDYLKKNPNFEIRISGYSDDAGSFDENTERSRLRAQGVMQYFMEKGLPEKKILPRWSGSFGAIAPNNTETGRRQNRRVDLVIIR
jgi:outer membrane protein OmpA-like peptidoglycan-associated protein